VALNFILAAVKYLAAGKALNLDPGASVSAWMMERGVRANTHDLKVFKSIV
jgi:hypothetical protein